jgi:hypothetical protein
VFFATRRAFGASFVRRITTGRYRFSHILGRISLYNRHHVEPLLHSFERAAQDC